MKTKEVTKQRHAEREFDAAVIDCKDEFGTFLTLEDIVDPDFEIDFIEDEE